PAEEIRVRLRMARIGRMAEDAGGIRLPDFDDQILQRRAVLLQHAAADLDRLALRRAAFKDGQVVCPRIHVAGGKEGADRGFSRWNHHFCSGVAARPRNTIWCSNTSAL